MQIRAWKFVVIALVAAAFLSAYAGYGLTLGIDLAGGSVLTYELERPNKAVTKEDTVSTADILQRRLDFLGLKEMSIRPAGENQILIQLPGISGDSAERIKKVIASAGQLYFKIVYDSEKRNGLLDTIRHQSQDPFAQEEIQRIVGQKALGQYIAEDDAYDTATYQHKVDGKVVSEHTVLLMNDDTVDGEYLSNASESQQFTTRPTINFEVNADGTGYLAKTTEKHQGSQMAIVLDGTVISAPRINSPITGGRGIIEGDFDKDEIRELVTVLRSGALPAKPKLASEDTIAPTLGEDSIRRGMNAIYLGVIMTLIFMAAYYRFAGVIADVALILNLLILLGVMSLFEATLTLPGIAGIVLTMGMAVDANILINERIREEHSRGVPIAEAVRGGYEHAFSAIIDSNVTTLLTAGILYYVGTGPIRGFAVTLAVGISSSLFTALWVTRVLFEAAIAKGFYQKPNYMTLLANPKIAFLKNRRPFVIAAIVIANLGYMLFLLNGDAKYGIDFRGGYAAQMRFKEPWTADEVKARIAGVEVEVDGAKIHPYESVEVQRLGEVVEGSKATSFQVLLSAHDDDVAAKPVTDDDAASEDELSEGERWARLSPQERFEVALHERFREALVPSAYGEPTWTEGEVTETKPDPEDPEKQVEATTTKRWMTMQVRFDEQLASGITTAAIEEAFAAGEEYAHGATAKRLEGSGGGVVTFEVRTRDLNYGVADELVKTQLTSALDSAFGRELSNPFPLKTSIGASVAENLKARGVMAIILSLLMMIVYIAFRFEFKAGIAAVMCLFHDVFAVLGVMMILGALGFDAKINLTTIAAFLTIVGYSINDTIVTFDRMRENVTNKRIDATSPEYQDVLNLSINQVLSRTILTSLTVLVVLVILALAGVNTLEGFTLALIAGAIFGTFSSVYVATPIMLVPGRRLRLFALAELALLVIGGGMIAHLVG